MKSPVVDWSVSTSEHCEASDRETVCGWLGQHNWAANPDFMRKIQQPEHEAKPLVILASSASGVVGGLFAETQLNWLRISIMAVSAEHRLRGIGSAMLAEAERQAIARSCTRAYVDSMEYQAPKFYRARGFAVAGQIPGWDSHGHTKYYFTKDLGGVNCEPVSSENDSGSSEIRIVEADLNDASHQAATLELVNAYSMDPMGDAQPLAETSRGNLISGLRQHPTTMVFLAFSGSAPVGLALCFRGFSSFAARPLINIHDFYVAPAHRGAGLGRRLMSAVEARARELGCCKLTLEVQENNHRARSVYAATGFARSVHVPEVGGAFFLTKDL